MMELVSQAEKEGITLAAMLSREMSTEEMDSAQEDLSLHLSENFAKIESFMSGVSVPSLSDLLPMNRDSLHGTGMVGLSELSDNEGAEEDST